MAIWVILFHYGHNYYPFNIPIIKTAIDHASFRVSFFFFISGFVMCLVYGKLDKIQPKTFYFKRFSRIFPLYWLAFIISILLVVFINHASPKGLVIITHVLGVQSCYSGYVLDLNYPTWSVSVELFFYACFPFVLNFMKQKSRKNLLFFGLFIWLVQSCEHIFLIHSIGERGKVAEEFINAFPLWHLPTFFIGMLTALLILRSEVSTFFRKQSFIILMFCLGVLIYLIFVPNPVLRYVHNGLLSPIFALIIIALYYDESILSKILNQPILSKSGKISFSLFLFQYPFWIICKESVSENVLKSSYFFMMYLFGLILFSCLIYLYIEKPLLNKLRKLN